MEEQKKSKQKRHNQVTFKPYNPNQAWLLPPTLGELIPSTHVVHLVNDAVEGMELDPIVNTYKGGGSSAYHPKMMLKALVYGYIEKVYSSRGIEKALKENICFMWLCGMQQPDHNSLNRFRNSQLKQTVKDVFAQVLLMLIEQGYVRMEDYYVDGTKMESVAGRYTYVWAKNVERYKESLLNKIAALIETIEAANEEAEAEVAQQEAQTSKTQVSDSEALQQTIVRLNEQLHDQLGENKQLKKKLDKLTKKYVPKLMKYEKQQRKLDGRSSYSKTDPDATFMRTKDDHLGNGQLKPCYNVQLGTENQFIINYTVHQTASDMATFTSHMDDTLELLEGIEAPKPKRAGGDAGYGNEENFEYLEKEDIAAYVKYPGFYAEQKDKRKNDPFHLSNLHYNEEQDYYVCPMGQHMTYVRSEKKKTKTGYEQTIRKYQAQRCQGCPLTGQCHKSKGNRTLQVNRNAACYREQAKQRLNSIRGIRMRSRRGVDTESVFGHLKCARNFRRYMLTGLEGVSTETGLLAIAHNFKKWWVMRCSYRSIVPLPPANEAKCALIPEKNSQLALVFEKKRA